MYKQRGAIVLILAFAAVLIGGAAIAGVGALSSDETAGGAAAPRLSSVDDRAPGESGSPNKGTAGLDQSPTPSQGAEEHGSEAPKEQPKVEPRVEPEEKPKEEPRDELEIVVLSPDNEAHVAKSTVLVKGLTHPEAMVSMDRTVADVNGDGIWWMRVELSEGRNRMTFHAQLGDRHAEASLVLFYEKPVAKRFTAHQKWEVVDGNPATNVYHGTGIPGSEVTVRSDHGRGSTDINDRGNWELKVRFEAPCNKAFAVSVRASTGESKSFRMKRVCRTQHEFTAHQKWEIVDGNPTSNIYWGTAKPNAKVSIGSEYGSGHTTADKKGNWELQVRFEAPCNEAFRVAAESGDSRKEFKMKRVCHADHEFTARQTYGSCGEEVPFDVFYGTGVPNTWVVVESDFGGGEVKVNEKGKWEIKVKFPTAPPGVTFKVFVSGEGGEAAFKFTNTGGGGDH